MSGALFLTTILAIFGIGQCIMIETQQAYTKQFKPNDCINKTHLTSASKTIHGDEFYLVIDKSATDGFYIVKTCNISVSGCSIEVDAVMVELYSKVTCPDFLKKG